MNYKNPNDDTPPFGEWIFISFGDVKTVGRVIKLSPVDEGLLSTYRHFDEHFEGSGEDYDSYQFYIQDMTSDADVHLGRLYTNPDAGFFESDFLDWYSDSIECWALLDF